MALKNQILNSHCCVDQACQRGTLKSHQNIVLMSLWLCAQANVQLCHRASEAWGCFTVTWRWEADFTSEHNIPGTDTNGCACVVREWAWESWGLRLQYDRSAINMESCIPWNCLKNSNLRLPTSHKCKTLSSGPVIHQLMSWTGDADTYPTKRPAESSSVTTHPGLHNTARETEGAESSFQFSVSISQKNNRATFLWQDQGRHQAHVWLLVFEASV